ncbi:MAG: beta-N-acetylhexosaminidase [Tenacibaculum sp.]
MRTNQCLGLFLTLLMISCAQKPHPAISPQIIPIPNYQSLNEGTFVLDKKVNISAEKEFEAIAAYFKEAVKNQYGISFESTKKASSIKFLKNSDIDNKEGYHLNVSPNEVLIEASSSKGAFYAVQSLLQLLPPSENLKSIAVQCLQIKDAPKFLYRGMHLDVGRHFFSVDFIKKYIDILAMLKMNTFHWHLTEDQGWRIEIKKYPKLQEIAAFRKETLLGHYNRDKPHKFDGKKYGGYYTQEQIKDIVKYATKRQINIIPEIEMPGHSQAALAAYPNLGCTQDTLEVATKWGVIKNIYCPKETTFAFLEGVIDEVIDLFPSKYIHIGGDEAPKDRWKKCTNCQKLIKDKNLKDEHGLQSYFITRMEKYINSKGRQIIGWDEILEGGLAPNATVMSWRGNKGAIEAAKQKHPVILSPNTHCYFDYYQSKNENEPLAIGGFLPLEKVYSFNPIPKELSKEEAQYVLGAQGNVWTEYMKTPKKVEYMIFPRIFALSEVVWSKPENKNYEDFINRVKFFFKRLDSKKINYANHLFELSGTAKNENDSLFFYLSSKTKGKDIRYTTDGSEPTLASKLYNKPILINNTVVIKAASFDKKKQLGNIFEEKIHYHKAIGQKVNLSPPPHKSYNKGGKSTIINGVFGSPKHLKNKEWLGFRSDSVKISVNFDKPTELSKVSVNFNNNSAFWVYAPKNFKISLDTGFTKTVNIAKNSSTTVFSATNFDLQKSVKQLTINVPSYGLIPKGKPGGGEKAWIFIDEVLAE